MMQMALYRGPATDTWHQVGHRLIAWFTGSPYSHCEIVINGMAMSSSSRDGGVRFKAIDFASGKWHLVPLPGSEASVWAWFATHEGEAYDWAGIARFIVPLLPQRHNQWFCSEACAAALGLEHPADWTPGMLAVKFTK